ncbi:PH domain-containing protein [Paenarthrobacter sp. Z7-10]|uniref:PH domain-containing protein n=1 Tax=Paenarthrobacter sp. Z7-10 TaxID=2787635 RepID=UPI0022A92B7F|nr:PH domain-containing protein [Paenarthrobacter sp. Z7-10]MCZ2401956.1 PH domain-containing protein [Paenarthrobacter sp. Z7-10]
MREPIDPPGLDFHRVSAKLIPLRFITLGIGALVVILIGSLPLVLRTLGSWQKFPGALAWALAIAALLAMGWRLALIPRQVRAIGYAERDDDLLIRRGLFFQRVMVVPYGRMQYVDVSVGPLERAFGLASVKMHTASASTNAALEGLPTDEAARLREQLSARGEAKLAGL